MLNTGLRDFPLMKWEILLVHLTFTNDLLYYKSSENMYRPNSKDSSSVITITGESID